MVKQTISWPSCTSVPTPYFPMVKAMGPERANRRQAHDHIDDAEDHLREAFDNVKISWPLLPRRCSAKPNSTANISTCRMLPLAKRQSAAGDNIEQERYDA